MSCARQTGSLSDNTLHFDCPFCASSIIVKKRKPVVHTETPVAKKPKLDRIAKEKSVPSIVTHVPPVPVSTATSPDRIAAYTQQISKNVPYYKQAWVQNFPEPSQQHGYYHQQQSPNNYPPLPYASNQSYYYGQHQQQYHHSNNSYDYYQEPAPQRQSAIVIPKAVYAHQEQQNRHEVPTLSHINSNSSSPNMLPSIASLLGEVPMHYKM